MTYHIIDKPAHEILVRIALTRSECSDENVYSKAQIKIEQMDRLYLHTQSMDVQSVAISK